MFRSSASGGLFENCKTTLVLAIIQDKVPAALKFCKTNFM